MKNAILLATAVLWLVGCALNPSADQTRATGGSTGDAEANATEKVCTYETGGRIGSRDRRVCRTVDVRQ